MVGKYWMAKPLNKFQVFMIRVNQNKVAINYVLLLTALLSTIYVLHKAGNILHRIEELEYNKALWKEGMVCYPEKNATTVSCDPY